MGFSRITSQGIDKIAKRINIEEFGAGVIESDLETKTKLKLKDSEEEIGFSVPQKSNISEKQFLKYINRELKKSDIYAEGVAYCVPGNKDNMYRIYGFFYKKRNKFIKPDK